ncbi:MAG: TIGR00282 family metallophosphoesterase [Clostridia bacterium]|nr:TIGR00282 family metallophosphoesterase [Clostridia bacterium]
MRILMLGDIVGKPGRRAVQATLDKVKEEWEIDFTVANGENAAGGNGITREIADELFDSGIDVLTMGNHVWDKKEIFSFIDQEPRILRPANYPPGTPGRGAGVFKTNKDKIGIISLSGRVFMGENLDCPFRTAEAVTNKLKEEVKIVLVDFHAEATSEKIALGWHLAGRVAAVCGTHTHVLTADERVLPPGTAYISDLGMTGPRDSVLGVNTETVVKKFLTQLPTRFEVASGPYQLNGVVLTVNTQTGIATEIVRISINEE